MCLSLGTLVFTSQIVLFQNKRFEPGYKSGQMITTDFCVSTL